MSACSRKGCARSRAIGYRVARPGDSSATTIAASAGCSAGPEGFVEGLQLLVGDAEIDAEVRAERLEVLGPFIDLDFRAHVFARNPDRAVLQRDAPLGKRQRRDAREGEERARMRRGEVIAICDVGRHDVAEVEAVE